MRTNVHLWEHRLLACSSRLLAECIQKRTHPESRHRFAQAAANYRLAACAPQKQDARATFCSYQVSNHAHQTIANRRVEKMNGGGPENGMLRVSRNAAYSITWMLCFAQISLSCFGHTETVTSPRCAVLSRYMKVRDWPMPPPMLRGILSFTIAW